MKRLTLSAEEDVINAAKRYAKEHGTSLSSLFSRFVLSLTADRPMAKHSLHRNSLCREASGLISLPNDVSDGQLLEDALVARYGG